MKKRSLNIFLVLVLFVAMLFAGNVRADSGWDGDYDFGGGYDSDWGSSSWDSDWDSSDWSSSGGGYYYSSNVSGIIPIIVVTVIMIFVIYTLKKNSISNSNTSGRTSFVQTASVIEKIKEVIPDFDKDDFERQVFDIYKNIQVAWMNFDYDTLRKYTTDELYNAYHSELMALKLKKQKNVMSEFELLSFAIVGIEKNDKSISLKVRAEIELYDYVAKDSGEVVRGSSDFKLVYNYEMTFTRGLGEKQNKCPNCNAPLENNQSSVCPYCDSVIISDNHDWVLSKKQMLSQRRKINLK